MSFAPALGFDAACARLADGATATDRPVEFFRHGLHAWRICALRGTCADDPEALICAQEILASGWWSTEMEWGFVLSSDGRSVTAQFLLPGDPDGSLATGQLPGALPGAEVKLGEDAGALIRRVAGLPHAAAFVGHPDPEAKWGLDPLLRALIGEPFAWIVLAHPVSESVIADELEWLNAEEQTVRDEFLARPGIALDNNAHAESHLRALNLARERAISAQQEGGWQVRAILHTTSRAGLTAGSTLLRGAYGRGDGAREPFRFQPPDAAPAFTFLRTAEAVRLTLLPRQEYAGFRIEHGHATGPDASRFATAPLVLDDEPALALGSIMDESQNRRDWLEMPLNDLTGHTLVAGITGSGKSTTLWHLLLQLHEAGIPWLVLEPGLNPSYRQLLCSAAGEDLRIFTLGDLRGQPLDLNVFLPPPGLPLAEHIGGLFAAIMSAFSLVPPMPEVLQRALYQLYAEHGWDPCGLAPAGEPPPTIGDLALSVERTVSELGYTGELAGNIRAGLVLRLRNLALGAVSNLFETARPVSIAWLLEKPTIIELAAISRSEEQALVLAMLLLQVRNHWRLAGRSATLRHVTVIEEAHRLLRAPSPARGELASPQTHAVEEFANLLAELRGMGAGLVIADQTPADLVPAVIKNTNTKILHCLHSLDDRRSAGGAAGLNESQLAALGGLPRAEAIVRIRQRATPYRVTFPNPALGWSETSMPDDNAVRTHMVVHKPPIDCPGCGSATCQVHGFIKPEDIQNFATIVLSDWNAALPWAANVCAKHFPPWDLQRATFCFLVNVCVEARLRGRDLSKARRFFSGRQHPQTT